MPVTRPTTKLTPDELLTHIHDALAVLGLGELRHALDETIAEPAKDESSLPRGVAILCESAVRALGE